MANSSPNYCGHKSLADMIIAHIEVWRDALKAKRSLTAMSQDDFTYIEHEMKALDDIEKACEKEIENGELQS